MVAIVVGAGGAVAHRVQSHDVVDGGRRGSAENAHRRVCLGEEEVKKGDLLDNVLRDRLERNCSRERDEEGMESWE